MPHESLLGILAQPTIGGEFFSVLLAAVPALVGGGIRFLLLRAERREKEKFRRFVEQEAADRHKHHKHGRKSESGDSGGIHRSGME